MIQWQIVDRNMKIFEWDLNGDDILSNDEIRTGWTTDKFFHGMGVTLDQILSPEGFWEKNAFLKMLRDDFKAYVDETMSVSDDASYPIQQKPDELIMASQQWWKWWFSDQSSTLDDLVGFNGKIITHNGDFDSQTPGVRELGFVQARLAEFAVPPTTILHPGMGHGMNSNSPTYGPMDESVRRMIVNDINSLVGPFSTECH
jgi:hypothetical protein